MLEAIPSRVALRRRLVGSLEAPGRGPFLSTAFRFRMKRQAQLVNERKAHIHAAPTDAHSFVSFVESISERLSYVVAEPQMIDAALISTLEHVEIDRAVHARASDVPKDARHDGSGRKNLPQALDRLLPLRFFLFLARHDFHPFSVESRSESACQLDARLPAAIQCYPCAASISSHESGST